MNPSIFKAFLGAALTAGGNETVVQLDRITTLSGQMISTSLFAQFGRGVLSVNPDGDGVSSTPEFISFTVVDQTNLKVTGCTRNLSSISNSQLTTPSQYFPVSTPVIISWGFHQISDLVAYVGNLVTGEIGNASSTVSGTTKLSLDPISPTSPIAVGDNDPRIPTSSQVSFLNSLFGGIPGTPIPTFRRTAASGWFFYDGSTISRSSCPLTFAALCPSQTATVTIASPGVVTATAHGLVAGDRISFITTGGLPSGISIGIIYYVLATSLATDTFEFALSPAGTAVFTTGSQSGVHTIYKMGACGVGDGSSTFSLPNMCGKVPVGLGSTNNIILSFEPGAVDTSGDAVAVPDGVFPSQGQPITLTTTGTLPAGLSTSTTYYIIRVDSTHVAFAAGQGNANATSPTKINITDTGLGVHTINYALTARTIIGGMLGEETHAVSSAELPNHTHAQTFTTTSAPSGSGGSAGTPSTPGPTGSTGGDLQHNNMPPSIFMNWMGISI